MKLSELKSLNGKLLRDGDFSTLGRVRDWQEHRLVPIASEAELNLIANDRRISSVLVSEANSKNVPTDKGVLIVDEPNIAFNKIHSALVSQAGFYPADFVNQISEEATIHKTAIISEKSVRIERNCRIGPKVVIGPQTVIGEGTYVGPGTILGMDPSNQSLAGSDFGLARGGGVIIGKKAWIHANCVIERSAFKGFTEIGDYTYLDNLVSIGAGARVGKACQLIAASVVGENVSIGDGARIGPNSVIADGIKIGNKGVVTIGSVVVEDVPDGAQVTGNFAIDHKRFIEFIRRIR
jgi:UDP-3-O-[3-hydroxymyristoyl] glucosamine N-acyltransferase